MEKIDNGQPLKVAVTVLLIRCPSCKRENYASMVSVGVCCWCGYDAKEEQNKQ